MHNEDAGEVDKHELLAVLADLRDQHRKLDLEVNALLETGAVDMLKLGRMKKIKLKLKDKIAAIEDSLTPDIIA